jgi:hypothetical protein
MATSIGWYIVPNVTKPSDRNPAVRSVYCAVGDYTTQIQADGGDWSNTEVLGGYNIVKVKASDTTLTMLDGLFLRVPVALLDSNLSSLTAAQKNRVHTTLNDMGYSDADIVAVLGNFNNIGQKTLRQLFNFVASRRQVARYNAATDSVIYDGAIVVPTPVDAVDAAIQ